MNSHIQNILNNIIYLIYLGIPSYNRSIYLANLWIAFPIGELYVCIVGLFIMPNFEKDQWRSLLLYCLIPVFICTFCSLFLLESGRFLLTNKRYDEAKEFFFRLAEIANVPFSNEKMLEIQNESILNPVNKYESSFALLVNKRFIKLSLLTWVIWWVGSFGLYTTIYMLPQTLDSLPELQATKEGKMFKDVIISNLISLPKSLLSGFLAQIPFLGRKYSMCYAFICLAFFEFLLIVDITNVAFYSGFLKLLTGCILGIVKVYSTEAYPTKIRGIGYGTGHSISRIAGCLVPFICEFLRSLFGILGPSYFLFLLALFSAYCCHDLPFETLGRVLDKCEEEDIIELQEIENNNRELLEMEKDKTNK